MAKAKQKRRVGVPKVPEGNNEWRSWARKEVKAATRRRGRPQIGKGATSVTVSVERGLLKRIDTLANKRLVSRSQLFVEAMESMLSREKAG